MRVGVNRTGDGTMDVVHAQDGGIRGLATWGDL
jgi:hypothetical protein